MTDQNRPEGEVQTDTHTETETETTRTEPAPEGTTPGSDKPDGGKDE